MVCVLSFSLLALHIIKLEREKKHLVSNNTVNLGVFCFLDMTHFVCTENARL